MVPRDVMRSDADKFLKAVQRKLAWTAKLSNEEKEWAYQCAQRETLADAAEIIGDRFKVFIEESDLRKFLASWSYERLLHQTEQAEKLLGLLRLGQREFSILRERLYQMAPIEALSSAMASEDHALSERMVRLIGEQKEIETRRLTAEANARKTIQETDAIRSSMTEEEKRAKIADIYGTPPQLLVNGTN